MGNEKNKRQTNSFPQAWLAMQNDCYLHSTQQAIFARFYSFLYDLSNADDERKNI